MILLIDNYDSFTFNLVHLLGDLGIRSDVVRNDALTTEEAVARKPEAIVLSPGPCTPNEAGICLDLIAAAAGTIPLLGVCLGPQAIGQAFGANVRRGPGPLCLRHRTAHIFAVQFHPESIASEHGQKLLANFMGIVHGRNQRAAA